MTTTIRTATASRPGRQRTPSDNIMAAAGFGGLYSIYDLYCTAARRRQGLRTRDRIDMIFADIRRAVPRDVWEEIDADVKSLVEQMQGGRGA